MSKEDQSVSNTPEEKTIVSNETVSYETHKKLLGQRKNDQAEMAMLKANLEKYETEKRTVEEQKLAEQGEFKKLLQVRNEELQKVLSERDQYKENLQDTWKFDAFHKKLGGKLENSKYLTFVDKESIIYNPETGEIDEQSVELVVNKFRTEHAGLITPYNKSKLPSQPANLGLVEKSISSMSNEEKHNKLTSVLGRLV